MYAGVWSSVERFGLELKNLNVLLNFFSIIYNFFNVNINCITQVNTTKSYINIKKFNK